jgi:hypothetical protein
MASFAKGLLQKGSSKGREYWNKGKEQGLEVLKRLQDTTTSEPSRHHDGINGGGLRSSEVQGALKITGLCMHGSQSCGPLMPWLYSAIRLM